MIPLAKATPPAGPSGDKLLGVLPLINQKVRYAAVVDCGSVSQAELFRRTRLWLLQTGADETLALSDPQTGDLAGRVKLTVQIPRSESASGGVYRFRGTVLVECANRKYRATLTRLQVEDANGQPLAIETYGQRSEKDLQAAYTELDRQLRALLASLEEEVKNYPAF